MPLASDAPEEFFLLLSEWRQLSDAGGANRENFDLERRKTDEAKLTVITKHPTEDGSPNFMFEFVGRPVARQSGVDPVGYFFSDMIKPHELRRLTSLYIELFVTGEPQYREFAQTLRGAPSTAACRLFLPLSDSSGAVECVACFYHWREDF
ncbi:MAG: hypothetical protein MRY74_01635 [Neomegalonema sp.]|nr:hypothetical protein [Neomegalonema sp.]